MQEHSLDIQLFDVEIHVDHYAQHYSNGCHLHYGGKNLVEIHSFLPLEALYDDLDFESQWIPPISWFQLVYLLIPERLLPYWQLDQFVCMVLMQAIHLLLHDT